MSALRPLIDRYRAGQISRREFLTAATAFGVTLPAATSILSSQSQAAPKKGGHVRGAATGGSTTDTLDPALLVDPYLYTLNYTLRNNLTEILPDGSLVGELAESWEASPDAKVWTFKLRDGVEFHNGKTIDSEDVVGNRELAGLNELYYYKVSRFWYQLAGENWSREVKMLRNELAELLEAGRSGDVKAIANIRRNHVSFGKIRVGEFISKGRG